MSTIAQESSLFEIDQELDLLLDEIQEQTATEGEEEIPAELILRFQQFCDAHYEKVDRIGRFLTLMEWRTQYCKAEAARLYERARIAESKADRTKIMLLYYLSSCGLRKIEGREFTLRAQRNSQDSARILNETQVPHAGHVEMLRRARSCISIAPSFGRRQTRVTSAMFGTRHPCLISRSEARQSYLRLTP